MKRVLQSCFDPLPRFMSMKGLAAVVTLVLVGTAISVFEYLESARVPVRRVSHPPAACKRIDGGCENRPDSGSSLSGPCPRAVSDQATSCAPRAMSSSPGQTLGAEPDVRTAPPSLFEPALDSIGG